MIKIAVIGTGIIGRDHLKNIAQSEECALCAVCDINEASAAAEAEKYGVAHFTDYKDIVKKTDADAVIINLPHFLHCEVTEFFLNNGKHVLVEKPMANTTEECDRMIAAAKRSGAKLAVGHVQRFFGANRRVKEIYDSGELGKFCMYRELRTTDYFTADRPKWFLNKKQSGGGIVMNYGAHALDKLFYVTGHESANVTAVVGNIKNDAEIEGHAQILLRFPDDTSAEITFCSYAPSGYEAMYFFTEGTAKVVGSGQLWITRNGQWEHHPECEGGNAMARELSEFCKYIRGEASEIATPEFSRAVIAVIEEIYKPHIEKGRK